MLPFRLPDGSEIGPPAVSEPGAPLFGGDEVPRLIARLETPRPDPYVRDGLRALAAWLLRGAIGRPAEDGSVLRRVAEALRNGELVWIRPEPKAGFAVAAPATPPAASPAPAKAAAQKGETVEQRAERRAKEYASEFPRRPRPAAACVAIDRNRNSEYKGNSSPPHPTGADIESPLRERRAMLLERQKNDPTVEQRDPAFCAEFKAANKALKAGVRLEELVVFTVKTSHGTPFPRCPNCRVTLEGASAPSG